MVMNIWNIVGVIGAALLLLVIWLECKRMTILDYEAGALSLFGWLRHNPCVGWLLILAGVVIVFGVLL